MNTKNSLLLKNMEEQEIYQEITEHFGTPCYVYSADKIKENYQLLKNAISDQVELFYSIKANPNLSVCAVLNKLGAGAEVCSLSELEIALKSGFTANKIIFVGPHKTKAAILLALQNNIQAIVCESLEELQVIEDLAAKNNTVAKILIRINPDFYAKSALLKMGGKPSQFGIDETQVRPAIRFALENRNINLLGIHVYNGTRILNSQTIVENTENILNLAVQLQQEFNYLFEIVDFGGGAGIAYFENESGLVLTELHDFLVPVLEKYRQKFKQTKLIMESGRFLVGSAGKFIVEVDSIKKSKGENFIITNGGTNCFMAAVGIGSLIKTNFPISLISSNKNKDINRKEQIKYKLENYNVTGPLCTPNDLLAKNVSLPSVATGDKIIVHQAGAYGPSASPGHFLSHGFPAEVLIASKQAYLIRKADCTEDLLKNQILID